MKRPRKDAEWHSHIAGSMLVMINAQAVGGNL